MVSCVIEIEVETDAIDGTLLLSECSRIFHASLRGRIERRLRLAAAVGPSEVKISRMVLDLGDLSVTQWRTELGERLDMRLAAELAMLDKVVESAPLHDGMLARRIPYRASVPVQVRRDAPARASGASGMVVSRTATSHSVAVRTVAHRPEVSVPKKPTTEPISGGGIVLLWPFLTRLWSVMGYVENGEFRDIGSRLRAVGSLDWLLGLGDSRAADLSGLEGLFASSVARPLPSASRLICGLALDSISDQPSGAAYPSTALTDTERSQLTAWRDSLPARLPGLARCGPGDITSLFLQRPGTVRTQNGVVTLHVERDASDILLRSIPWPMQQLVLPWLETPVNIDWL